MAKEDNLVPLSTKKAREIGKKGGIASGKAKREKKTLKAAILAALENKYTSSDGVTKIDGFTAVAVALIDKALEGDVPAINSIRDTIGEKPTDKLDVGSGENGLRAIKISFVDKTKNSISQEKDPKIVGDYTKPIDYKGS